MTVADEAEKAATTSPHGDVAPSETLVRVAANRRHVKDIGGPCVLTNQAITQDDLIDIARTLSTQREEKTPDTIMREHAEMLTKEAAWKADPVVGRANTGAVRSVPSGVTPPKAFNVLANAPKDGQKGYPNDGHAGVMFATSTLTKTQRSLARDALIKLFSVARLSNTPVTGGDIPND